MTTNKHIQPKIIEKQPTQILDCLPAAVAIFKDKLIQANQNFINLLGRSYDELTEYHFLDLIDHVDRPQVKQHIEQLNSNNNSLTIESRYSNNNLAYKWLQWFIKYQSSDNQFYVIAYDVSEYKHSQQQLLQSVKTNRLLLDSVAEGVLGLSLEGNITFVNPAAQKILGYTENEMLGQAMHALIHHSYPDGSPIPLQENAIQQTITQGVIQYVDAEAYWHKNGSGIPIKYTSAPIKSDNKLTGAVVIFNDITEQIRAQKQLIHLAHFDYLTNLPNRVSFEKRLAATLNRNQRNNHMFALLYLDLDRFKKINDTLGHDVGDELLKQVAARIQNSLRSYDFVARLSGDEFAMILHDFKLTSVVGKIATKVLANIAEPYNIKQHRFSVTGSIGIAVYPIAGENKDELLKHADQALYQSKNSGRNQHHYFNDKLNYNYKRYYAIEKSLSQAIEKQQLYLVFTPIGLLKNNKIHHVKISLRWQHPELGIISPTEFIPIAEDNGTLPQIYQWLFDEVCATYQQWQKKPAFNIKFSINLHLSLSHPLFDEILNNLHNIASNKKINPDNIQLNINEIIIINHYHKAKLFLDRFHLLGYQLAIDKYGSSNSSLLKLNELPIHTINIDKVLTSNLLVKPDKQPLVIGLIKFAQQLDINVAAKGITTQTELSYLKKLGFDYGQGVVFGRNLKLTQILSVLNIC